MEWRSSSPAAAPAEQLQLQASNSIENDPLLLWADPEPASGEAVPASGEEERAKDETAAASAPNEGYDSDRTATPPREQELQARRYEIPPDRVLRFQQQMHGFKRLLFPDASIRSCACPICSSRSIPTQTHHDQLRTCLQERLSADPELRRRLQQTPHDQLRSLLQEGLSTDPELRRRLQSALWGSEPPPNDIREYPGPTVEEATNLEAAP